MRAVNLIPADQREGAGGAAGRSHGVAYAVLALLAGAALLALLYGQAHRQVSSRTEQLASLSARAQQAQAQASGLSAYTSFTTLREERERAVSQLVDARFDWAHSFHELGRVLPSTASISSIVGAVGSAAGSSASASGAAKTAVSSPVSSTPPGSVPSFTLTGCATSQAQVAVTLNRLRLIDGVSEVTLQSSTKGSAGTGGSASAGCPTNGPTFTALLTFDSLPAASSATASAVSNTSGSAR